MLVLGSGGGTRRNDRVDQEAENRSSPSHGFALRSMGDAPVLGPSVGSSPTSKPEDADSGGYNAAICRSRALCPVCCSLEQLYSRHLSLRFPRSGVVFSVRNTEIPDTVSFAGGRLCPFRARMSTVIDA